MASLRDISRRCGFSIRTVNRVLKGDGYVSPETRSRVMAAAAELDYRPNLAARALRTGRSSEILAVLGSMDELHVQKLEAFEARMRQEQLPVQIIFAGPDDGPQLVTLLGERRPAAMALFPAITMPLDGVLATADLAGTPVVAIDRQLPGRDVVTIDRQQGVYEAVLHLASSGRRRIAYAGKREDASRVDGYHRAMAELGRAADVRRYDDGQLDELAMGQAAVAELLEDDERPDALLVHSDVMACGVLQALDEAGVAVGSTLAVVGFDDRPCARLAHCPLTTVAQPNRSVGTVAAEILLDRLGGHADEGPVERRLPTTLVLRRSA